MSATRSSDAAAALWDFCVAVYDRPGVAETCLRLQDAHGTDIPLLLAALWSAVDGPGVLGADDLAALDRCVAPWRENVVQPLRRTRRWMKASGQADDPVRAQVKRAELAAERRELEAIADWLSNRRGSGGDAQAAVTAFLHWAGCADADLQALTAAVQDRSR